MYLNIYLKSKKGCKDFYNLLNKNQEIPSAVLKWEQIYDVSEETWKDIFKSPFKYKYSSVLQWFQTRINHRILPTKNIYIQSRLSLVHCVHTVTRKKQLLIYYGLAQQQNPFYKRYSPCL